MRWASSMEFVLTSALRDFSQRALALATPASNDIREPSTVLLLLTRDVYRLAVLDVGLVLRALSRTGGIESEWLLLRHLRVEQQLKLRAEPRRRDGAPLALCSLCRLFVVRASDFVVGIGTAVATVTVAVHVDVRARSRARASLVFDVRSLRWLLRVCLLSFLSWLHGVRRESDGGSRNVAIPSPPRASVARCTRHTRTLMAAAAVPAALAGIDLTPGPDLHPLYPYPSHVAPLLAPASGLSPAQRAELVTHCLTRACVFGDIQVLSYLLSDPQAQPHVDLNVQDEDGLGLITVAILGFGSESDRDVEREECVRLLVQEGANPNLADNGAYASLVVACG